MKRILVTENQFKTVVREMMGAGRSYFAQGDGNAMTSGRVSHSEESVVMKEEDFKNFLVWFGDKMPDGDQYDELWDRLYNDLCQQPFQCTLTVEKGVDEPSCIGPYEELNAEKSDFSQVFSEIDGLLDDITPETKQLIKDGIVEYAKDWLEKKRNGIN